MATRTLTTHYIDGAFVESHGRQVTEILRPTDRRLIARVTLADEEDTRRAIAAATRAFATYGHSTTQERTQILRRLHEAAADSSSPASVANAADTVSKHSLRREPSSSHDTRHDLAH